ncbi:MAG: ankyrin repeat domain-containing protein [Spirochaetales bacterium]|nr:ankyrin repeat domain-containing protein [Spirochaetales bacterium]
MKWLIITDSQTFTQNITSQLELLDKKNKCVVSSFEIEQLKKQKKAFKSFASIIVYCENIKSIEASVSSLISLSGFVACEKIPLITNIKDLEKNELFCDDLILLSSSDEFEKKLKKDYKKISEAAKKRLAKNKLLDRGIPFTSDCFGTYIAKNKIEIVNDFLEAGMSVNSRDDTGTPMLNIACRNDNYEFVEMLLGLGAELDAVSDDRGYTAVMDAVWRGNEKITKFLISKGAQLNTINKEGQCNLILAVGANRENLVRILAENGADPDVKDMMGMSAYNYATLFKKDRLVEILKPYHKEA